MTQSSADKIANVVLGVAAVGAAYYVVRTPPLRRLAWRLAMTALTGTIPAWIGREIQKSWDASAPSRAAGR